ncbi:MAG: DNA helicase RecQ [Betaproteobacteria bacterium]|nr:DNA helicase RecQ [Betaproteobacteria bacterium]
MGILQSTFGYPAFRPGQEPIIEHVISGGDALVLMPTGGGKSMCFQIPALAREGCGVVVSPLIALMQDQVDTLKELGVKAGMLNSALDSTTAASVERAFIDGALDLLYVAPERLLTPRFLDLLSRARVALFAIDEAHCVSQWGHDFRPEYRQLTVLHERFPEVPRIALTATADAPTRNEIVERLQLEGAKQFVSSFDRPNIRYTIEEKQNSHPQLLDFLKEHRNEAGIVYRLSRKKVEDTAEFLAQSGFDALPYHAGLDAATRARNQDRFIREEGVIMVATIAFGMGIDKPNVRFVAHLDLPKSMEGYYQETGRAGRDGLPADAWMAFGMGDVVTLKQMVENSEAGEERKRLERQKLEALLGMCESAACRRQTLLGYFGERLLNACGNCDNCLDPPQTYDGTIHAQMALSAVARTGQRFGVAHLCDVLTGKMTEKIAQFDHDRLPTFGVGTDVPDADWRRIFRQLAAMGFLAVDLEGYGGLKLTAASRAILKGDTTVTLRRAPEKKRLRKSAQERSRARNPIAPVDDALWQALRETRLALSKEFGVPPYVIFHDATLQEMLARRPSSMDGMRGISGVGERKLAKFGAAFLDVIRAHTP